MREFFDLALPHLDERQRRFARGAFSHMLGRKYSVLAWSRRASDRDSPGIAGC